ncbi:MAG: hypothetical protein J6R18_05865 [Kiritimatiellae bacterium]|nr:hypothetical protein [Kiritimatiellia bacterium]
MKKILSILSIVATAGCITVTETEFPQTSQTSLPDGKEVSVKLQGFAATVTDYAAVHAYDTVWVSGHPRGHHGWVPGRYATVASTTYVPQARNTEFFLERAKTSIESSGFITQAQQPEYLVDVTFNGPFVTDEERGIEALCLLLSIFSADYSVQTWTAKVKIYDNKTGKMIFHHDYTQRYKVAIWGPLPILSPSGSSKSTSASMQNWCLTALTDRTVADITAFLAKKVK